MSSSFASHERKVAAAVVFTAMRGMLSIFRSSQAEQDVVDERDRQGDEHAKNDSASSEQGKIVLATGASVSGDWRESLNRSWCVLVSVRAGVVFSDTGGTYAVLRMSGCTLYSFAKTKGTMPWGRAACSFRRFLQREKPKTSRARTVRKRGQKKVTFVLSAEGKRPRRREGEKEASEQARGDWEKNALLLLAAPRSGGGGRQDFSRLRMCDSISIRFPSFPCRLKVPGRWRRAEASHGGPRRRTRRP